MRFKKLHLFENDGHKIEEIIQTVNRKQLIVSMKSGIHAIYSDLLHQHCYREKLYPLGNLVHITSSSIKNIDTDMNNNEILNDVMGSSDIKIC